MEIDFQPPWPRYSYIEELEKQGGFKVPMPLESDECHAFLEAKCKELDIEVTPPHTTPRLLDKLVEHFVERLCLNPSFICDQPAICSPLAKYHRSKPGMCERFELFVNYTELANAYTELNNPIVQRERFMQQAKDKSNGDEEAQCLDEDFCVAMEHGLPPTGGWGLGVDRLTMFLTDSNNIKEVLLFPAMKPVDDNKPEASALPVCFISHFPSGSSSGSDTPSSLPLHRDEERTEKHRQHVLHECGSSGTNLLHRSHFSVYRTLPN